MLGRGYDVWLTHFSKVHGPPPETNGLLRFETCLRTIDLDLNEPARPMWPSAALSSVTGAGPNKVLLHPNLDKPIGNHDVMSNEAAYQFMLELICGLKSRVLGETEVLGQFKDFCAKGGGSSHWMHFSPWMKSLLQDAKEVREKYLRGVGQQSYGGYLRNRLAPNSNLLILGAGSLLADILPWLAGHRVKIAARQMEKAIKRIASAKIKAQSHIEVVSTLSPIKVGPCAVIVAAPIDDEELRALLQPVPSLAIFDFRAEGSNLRSDIPYHSLSDIFNSLTEQNQVAQERAALARQAIADLTEMRFYKSSFHRPFGWEDACP